MIVDEPWTETLTRVLREDGFCSSKEEAGAIMEVISTDEDLTEPASLAAALQEYLGISPDESGLLIKKTRTLLGEDSEEEELNAEIDQGHSQETFEDEDDADMIGEGDCELCERTIILTRHHLIPKSTWSKLEPRLLNAAVAQEKGDLRRASVIVGDGLVHLLDLIDSNDKASVRATLARTCNICRPCHSAVHRAHDNMTLARSYNTVEKLIEDETVFKFSKWASKQRVGKYARREGDAKTKI